MIARLYIDGFNFYYAIKHSNLPISLGWCDFRKLAEQHLLPKGYELGQIKYFTAPVEDFGTKSENRRQDTWIQAIKTIPNIEIIFGYYQKHGKKQRKEKQTDVKIAVHMILDVVKDQSFDRAVLISADIDLVPAAIAVAREVPNPRPVDIWFPPGRHITNWLGFKRKEIRCKEITQGMLEDSRLLEEIVTHEGKVIRCLPEWKKNNS